MDTQWIDCHSEKRHGGDRACRECNGQDILGVGDQSASAN